MAVIAYAPLARGRFFDMPQMQRIADKHGATPAQIGLKWLLDQEVVAAIPRAGRRESQQANLDAWSWNWMTRIVRRLRGCRRIVASSMSSSRRCGIRRIMPDVAGLRRQRGQQFGGTDHGRTASRVARAKAVGHGAAGVGCARLWRPTMGDDEIGALAGQPVRDLHIPGTACDAEASIVATPQKIDLSAAPKWKLSSRLANSPSMTDTLGRLTMPTIPAVCSALNTSSSRRKGSTQNTPA